ncbi:hypothetical protein [Winogradskyella sp. PG-2]|uniref:hypothetical protein n=1 Tax=Winogradskyella sp. PG-2 TaxID=754409 RepID=UPI00045861CD|nr:hypothetical protein [Winogradskyella sp. PG-2]BAO77057.1 hypothetical protein WPG_2827 [Winogradskyella sp. PG-2]
MKNLFTTFCLYVIAFNCNAQDPLKLADFEILNNTSWVGQLTYKDYQSGKPTSIDATTQIKIEDEKIVFNIQYTYEPNKNNKSSVKIKKEGTYFGNEKIVNNTLENGIRTFVTTYEGRDDGKKQLFILHVSSVKLIIRLLKKYSLKTQMNAL